MTSIRTFAADESGAVTVDWVVLTAAIVGLGIAVMSSVRSGVNNVASDIATDMGTRLSSTFGGNYTP